MKKMSSIIVVFIYDTETSCRGMRMVGGAQEGGNKCIHMVDSHCRTAETNTTL